MNKQLRTNVDCTIHATGTVRLESDISMDEAQRRLEALGNEVIERDDSARTFTILDTITHPTDEVWACDYCEAYSRSEQVILEHEAREHGINHS